MRVPREIYSIHPVKIGTGQRLVTSPERNSVSKEITN